MNRDPLPGDHAGRQPQPEAEEVAGKNVESEGMVRLCPVQVDRDGGNGYVRQRERDGDWAPPGQVENTGKEHVVYSDLLVRGHEIFAMCRTAIAAYFELQTILCAISHIMPKIFSVGFKRYRRAIWRWRIR